MKGPIVIDVVAALRHAHLAVRRWYREQRRLEMLQFRKNWALMRSEYELVGGPLDGQVIKCHARNNFFLTPSEGGGAYRHETDCRMHYYADAPTTSGWQGDLE
jgi:hypothetical protein